MKWEVKNSEYSNNTSFYLSMSTNNNNPLEMEKDLEEIGIFLKEKYFDKSTKSTFIEWVKQKLA